MGKKRFIRDFKYRIKPLHDFERLILIKAICADLGVETEENDLLNDIRIDFINDLNGFENIEEKVEAIKEVLDEIDENRSNYVADRLNVKYKILTK